MTEKEKYEQQVIAKALDEAKLKQDVADLLSRVLALENK